MIQCFIDDVAALRLTPPKAPSRAVRFVTWNVNVLCGPDWKTSIAAADVAQVLRTLDADVIVLQEVPIEALDVLWDGCLTGPMLAL